jgi:hypothetical protein
MHSEPVEDSGARRNLPLLSFIAVTLTVLVLYLLPSEVHIWIYRLVDKNFGISVGLMAISKTTHIVSFFIMTTLAYFTFKRIYLSIFLLILYAVLLEIAQGLIPHRSGDIIDLYMNMIGIVAGVALSSAIVAFRTKVD